eukprot:Em0005g1394a
MFVTFLAVVLLHCCASLTEAQQSGCSSFPTSSQVSALIGQNYLGPGQGTPPAITLQTSPFGYRVVCSSSSGIRNQYRFVSIVANYTTSDGAVSPPGVPIYGQFEFECVNSAWSATSTLLEATSTDRTVLSAGSAAIIANTTTNCAYCLKQSASNVRVSDDTNHCSACTGCSQPLCYTSDTAIPNSGTIRQTCCNFYLSDGVTCTTTCDPPSFPDANRTCTAVVPVPPRSSIECGAGCIVGAIIGVIVIAVILAALIAVGVYLSVKDKIKDKNAQRIKPGGEVTVKDNDLYIPPDVAVEVADKQMGQSQDYKNDDDLASKALALTRAMLSLPYSPDTAEDLGQAVRVAIRVASLSRHLLASCPLQPYVSTACAFSSFISDKIEKVLERVLIYLNRAGKTVLLSTATSLAQGPLWLMATNDALYQALFKAYTDAHPTKPKQLSQAEVAKRWNEMKKEADYHTKVNALISDLKAIAMTKKGRLLAFWGNQAVPNHTTEGDSDHSLTIEAPSEATNSLSSVVSTNPNELCTSGSSSRYKSTAQTDLQHQIDLINGDLVGLCRRQSSNMLTKEQETELHCKKRKKEELEKLLKKKRDDQKRAQKYRAKRKHVMLDLCEKNPEVKELLKLREKSGRPRLEEDQPLLLQAIVDIALHGAPAHERRQCEDMYPTVKLGALPLCRRCGKPLLLLVQVYCPLEGSEYHRLQWRIQDFSEGGA